MASNPLLYQLLLVALVLICLLIHVALPDDSPRAPKTPSASNKRQRKRSTEPKPFPGFIHKPLGEACEQGADGDSKAPDAPVLTVGGELNKLAANISIGRNAAGVHWRSDYTESVRLGEQVAIGILREQQLTYNEVHHLSFTTFDGQSLTI